MDLKKRMALEAKIQDYRKRIRAPRASALDGKILEYILVHVERHGEDIYLSAMDEGPKGAPKHVHSLKLNAVTAMQMAADVLEAVKDLFPDTLQIEAIRTLPKGELH
jgi:hypothetical protein